MSNILHITNGDNLNDRLKLLGVEGQFAVWREMLCEGKTKFKVGSAKFIETRKDFLYETYDIDPAFYEDHFGSQLDLIATASAYDEVVLWFEYDLFCHINLVAAIAYLKRIEYKGPLFLVCSGRIEDEKGLRGLSELNDMQLLTLYKDKIPLNEKDLAIAVKFWRLYCKKDHTRLHPSMAKDSSFEYLSNCISAHKERFPQIGTGLNTLETQLLKLIDKFTIKSEHQFCGYGLTYQGYYGFGDMQIYRMIRRLTPYYDIVDGTYTLNLNGRAIIDDKTNLLGDTSYECTFGGAAKYDYAYNPISHQLLKHL